MNSREKSMRDDIQFVSEYGKRSITGLSLCIVLAGCGSLSQTAGDYDEIFTNPRMFLDTQVTVCGYVHDRFEDQNIWQRRPQYAAEPRGLGLLVSRQPAEASRIDGGYGCLTGTIVFTGCAQQMICAWSNFPYALRVADD